MIHTQDEFPLALYSHHLGKDLDQLRKAIDEQIIEVKVSTDIRRPEYDGYMANLSCADIQVGYVMYGTRVNVMCEHDDVFCLVIPLAGWSRVSYAGAKQVQEVMPVYYLPPNVELDMDYSADCGHVIIRFHTTPAHQQVFSILMEQQGILTTKQTQYIYQSVVYFLHESAFWYRVQACREIVEELKQNIFDAIYENTPENGELDFSVNDKLDAAIRFMHEQPHWEYSIDELVQVTGTPLRTLYWSFKHYLGITPYRYYVVNRLKRVRLDILKFGKNTTITQIAMAHGFVHLSRFSQQYKALFGELPIETQGKHFASTG
ncbi:AraC family transcriptional regulator [Bermanella sp. R86510]|uniref:AraC family transcriptional regulator n=1 Tax=unclassified Bermanella TaxID=2627862 RepID=UPI0037C7327B